MEQEVQEQIRQIFQNSSKTEQQFRHLTPEEKWEEAVDRRDMGNKLVGHLPDVWCAKCLNKGFTFGLEKHEGIIYEVAIPCECMERRKNRANARETALADVFNEYSLRNYHADEPWQKAIKDGAEEYIKGIEKSKDWFFIGGQTGAGKTHICTAIVSAFISKGRKPEYMMWRDDSMRIKLSDMSGYTNEIEKYKKADVLYIDDLFKTTPTDADVGLAFEIINYRAMSNRVTLISSERTLDEILTIDEALGGRIKQKAKWFKIEKDKNKNYRLRGAEK